jgi:PAS domain S-box-containing protein
MENQVIPYTFIIAILLLIIIGILVIIYRSRYQQFNILGIRDSVLNNMDDGVIVLDSTERVIFINPLAGNLLGNPATGTTGQHFMDDLLPGWRNTLKSIPGTNTSQGETTLQHNGELTYLEIHCTLLTKVKGGITGWQIQLQNISQRKQAESQLKLQSIALSAAANAIVITDRVGNIIWANTAFSRVTGYDLKDVLGRTPSILKSGAHDQTFYENLWNTIIKGEVWQGEIINRRSNGENYTEDMTIAPVRDENGSISHFIAIKQDISARKESEQALEKAYSLLEESVLRANQLAVQAEQANQAKSAFLASMSHEIRTPMNAIIGMTGLMMDTRLDYEQRDFIETIRNSSEGLLDIINEILDFSKIESGALELEQHPFNLRECVEGSIDLLATRAAQKNIELAYFIEPDVPISLLGDVTRLRQVFVNLIGNAVKFTQQGEVVVTVSGNPTTRQITAPDEHRQAIISAYEMKFSVRDTGLGIPADRLDRLFKPFSQVDSSTTRQFGGTGLGLAISKRLVELMDGQISVESELGKGSNFTFSITALAMQNEVPSPRYQRHATISGKKALVVDDNQTNRRILLLQLQSWGMVVKTFASAIEALDTIHTETYDIGILDFQMPDMSGLELAKQIRRKPAGKQLPLIMLTSLGRRENLTDGPDFAAYLYKPAKPSQLYDNLVRIFTVGEQLNHVERPLISSASLSQPQPGLRILLAEDNPINQKVTLLILGKLGLRADVAANGFEVLVALQRQIYDLIFMDVQMPELDGLEATRRIRKDFSPERQPKIFAMTANALQGDRELCLHAGMDGYIGKPVRMEELVAAISTCPSQPTAGNMINPGLPAQLAIEGQSIQRSVLADLCTTMGTDGATLVVELIDIFIEDTPKYLTELQTSLDSSDWKTFTRAAHTMKSSCANLGAMRLSDKAKDTETAGRNILEGLEPPLENRLSQHMVKSLVDLFDQARAELLEMKAEYQEMT